MPGRVHGHGLEGEGDAGRFGARRSPGLGVRSPTGRALFGRPERLEQAEGDIPMDRILPDEQGDLFPQDGETQRPVRQQQRTPDVGRVAGVQPHDPAGQSDPDDDLQSLDDHDPTEEPLVGPCPLDQQALVLPAHGTLRPVGATAASPRRASR